jgi:hypothetical protein
VTSSIVPNSLPAAAFDHTMNKTSATILASAVGAALGSMLGPVGTAMGAELGQMVGLIPDK